MAYSARPEQHALLTLAMASPCPDSLLHIAHLNSALSAVGTQVQG